MRRTGVLGVGLEDNTLQGESPRPTLLEVSMSMHYLSRDTVRYETGGFWELVSWFLWTDPIGPGATGDLLVPSEERARHHVWDLPSAFVLSWCWVG